MSSFLAIRDLCRCVVFIDHHLKLIFMTILLQSVKSFLCANQKILIVGDLNSDLLHPTILLVARVYV